VPSSDKLTIDTPEQIVLELPLAGIGSRFLAYTFDTLLQFAASIVVFLLVALGVGWFHPFRWLTWGTAILPQYFFLPLLILFFFSLYWGYFALFEIIWNGQTPGKRKVGIRVIKDTGRPLTALEAVARNLMRAVDGLPGMYGVALITMMLNQQHRRLGDFVAGTVVVHDKSIQDVRPDWNRTDTASNLQTEAIKVSAEELVLIETYLHRRHELEPAIAASTSKRIVAVIKAKTGLEPTAGQSDDSFLENIAGEIRNTARFR
jgi:uncharacterized RDD family membrane protein YckC